MIAVTKQKWSEISNGSKGITPLTKRRQVMEECLVENGSGRRMLTEGVNFYVDDEEGRKYAEDSIND